MKDYERLTLRLFIFISPRRSSRKGDSGEAREVTHDPFDMACYRINPAWAATLDRVVASLVPELPPFESICDGPDIDLSGR